MGMVLVLPLPERKAPRAPKPIRYMTQEELKAFLVAVRDGGSDQHMAIFYMAYRYGMRVSEVARMLWEDVQLEAQRVRIPRAKGGHENEYALPEDLCWALLKLRPTGGVGSPYVFRSSQGARGPMTTRRIQQLFDQYKNAAGIRDCLTMHSLRHSLAVHALETGIELTVIGDLLGHRSRKSTEVYARVSTRAREEASKALQNSPSLVRMEDL